MLRFLSPEWIDALDRAVRADTTLLAAAQGADGLVVEQRVVDPGNAMVCWHVAIGGGTVRIAAGAAPSPDVVLTVDRATAAQIARGEASAQRAFMAGQLRIGGDPRALIRHQAAFAAAGDAFAAVRAETDWG